MTFAPYQYPISTPRRGDAGASPPGDESGKKRAVAACTIPIGVESPIGDVLNQAAVVQRDVFLLHPSEVAFQRLLVGSTSDTTPDFLSVQVVQRTDAGERVLVVERTFKSLRVVPEVVIEATPWGEGPVFLRLRATYSAARMIATIEVLTNEVL